MDAPSVGDRLVYAVGDIHGRYDLFKQLLAQILEDMAPAPAERRLLVLCGDYIDRGPESPAVLEALLRLQARPEFEVRALKGNHEQALLDFIDAPAAGARWLAYGGAETLQSYEVRPPDDFDDAADCVRARDELLRRMPAAHLRVMEALELTLLQGDYLFAHAGVRPGAPLEAQTEQDLLWIRGDFLDFEGPLEKVVVHGHSWRDHEPQVRPYRIGIDTGAYATGVLTALRLEGVERRFLQTTPS